MQQVVVIHGGDSFLKYSDYLRFLRTVPLSRKSLFQASDWKANLPKVLGRQFQVFLPRMPNKFNAHYIEWKIWFERMQPLFKNNIILIGHSQGGIFLLKYLSENTFKKKVRALFLVAPPHSKTSGLGDFRLRKPLRKVFQQCANITFFFSKDDPVVPFHEMKRYQSDLPHAKYVVFKNRAHFSQSRFPEIIRAIKKA